MFKRLKGIVCALLCAVMCLSLCPFAFAAGTASQQTVLNKINEIAKQYPTGSYFSVNGKPCSPCGGMYCKNCGLTY